MTPWGTEGGSVNSIDTRPVDVGEITPRAKPEKMTMLATASPAAPYAAVLAVVFKIETIPLL